MKKKTENGKLVQFAAADLFLWLLLLLCIAGIVIRIIAGSDGSFMKGESGEYLISYVVTDVRSEYSDHFSEGSRYYLEDGTLFGVLSKDAVFTPTREFLENENGEYVASYNSSGRVDVKGTAKAQGIMTDKGFMLEDRVYVAANMRLTVHSDEMSAEILIMDISKVSVQN
ncbi:hypothetical protein IMSAG013_00848 [Clostridiales bacterium]|nr:hypothetical protein [Clostridiales bacterium]GFI55797.1 hypothetical protein IMSAG013_00848 [Clostridiales bacterium]